MCTVLFRDETEDARKMSAREAQQSVDRLMEYDRELAGPFTKDQLAELFKLEEPEPVSPIFSLEKEIGKSTEETQKIYRQFSEFLWEQNPQLNEDEAFFTREDLADLFERRDWGQAHGWRDYMVLTVAERKIVDELELTPKQKPLPEKLDRFKERNDLKQIVSKEITQIAGLVPDSTFYVFRYGDIFFIGFGNIFDTAAYADDLKQMKEEINIPLEDKFAVLLLKMLKSEHFALDKNKLHPDQVVFLESEHQKTLQKSESENLTISRDPSPREWQELEKVRKRWNNYLLLTEAEKQSLDELNLTPVKPQEYKQSDSTHACTNAPKKPFDLADARLQLKKQAITIPHFPEDGWHRYWNNTGYIYVWLDKCNYCESKYKGFYYVRYQLSMLNGGTTAYASPELIVEKKKLRPDQIEYMERKCQETFDAAKRLGEQEEQ